MSLPFHLVPALDGVAPGATVVVEGDEAHHAVAVRRLRPGERVALTDGRGTVATGAVRVADRRRLEVQVDAIDRWDPPQPSVTVVQALPKGDRAELAVEVLTEIGVERLVPWAASRSVAVWRAERAAKSLAKWRATAREAAKQSRRAWFPEVTELAATSDVCALVAEHDLALVLHEAAEPGLMSAVVRRQESDGDLGTVLVVVGPEGGLTDAEVSSLAAAGAHPVRLGPEVLRTSTAGLAAVAAVLAHTPRWNS
jgi:16S rRNA (uracil1498-N3)-methyltransferase